MLCLWHSCIYTSKYHCIAFTLFYIKVLPSLLYYPALFILFCPLLCVLSYTKTCTHRQKPFVGKYSWLLLSDLFPPSSLALCGLLLSLYPDLIRAAGECRQSGSTEINIQLRYEWGLPNNDWHTDIQRGWVRGRGRHGQTEGRENSRKWGVKSKTCVLFLKMSQNEQRAVYNVYKEKKKIFLSSQRHFYGCNSNPTNL